MKNVESTTGIKVFFLFSFFFEDLKRKFNICIACQLASTHQKYRCSEIFFNFIYSRFLSSHLQLLHKNITQISTIHYLLYEQNTIMPRLSIRPSVYEVDMSSSLKKQTRKDKKRKSVIPLKPLKK